MVRVFALIFILLLLPSAYAGELEVFAGGNSTQYDQASDANTWGVSLRAQYNFTRDGDTWMINVNAPGESLVVGTFSAGYLWRSQGSVIWECGLAGGYGVIYGPQAEVILGMGLRVTQNFFVDFPVMLGTSGVLWAPYLGFQF